MLRNFVATFQQTRYEKIFAVGIAQNHAWQFRVGNHARIVHLLLVGNFRNLPGLGRFLFWSFSSDTSDCEVRIVDRPASRWALLRAAAQAPATPFASDRCQRENRSVVAVHRNLIGVTV